MEERENDDKNEDSKNLDDFREDDDSLSNIGNYFFPNMTPAEIEDMMLNEAIRLSLLPNADMQNELEAPDRNSGSLHDSTESEDDLPLELVQ